jgi:hypothetical protein
MRHNSLIIYLFILIWLKFFLIALEHRAYIKMHSLLTRPVYFFPKKIINQEVQIIKVKFTLLNQHGIILSELFKDISIKFLYTSVLFP